MSLVTTANSFLIRPRILAPYLKVMVGQRFSLIKPNKKSHRASGPKTTYAFSRTLYHDNQFDLSKVVGDVHSDTFSRHYGNEEELHPAAK
ncbi:hypothetical protein TNIN_230391 [Trichonephila inaurata madagascariensis]|uniref:Uncharacterized protein n=1 Tax=Trichonephila inaurata madagascariensis TaxID=2747483 RepID=A0A8X6IW15_9ARAC|nr:hypothetical protein TNIN_230391 [Trichonephila inaurata madagascariensis]